MVFANIQYFLFVMLLYKIQNLNAQKYFINPFVDINYFCAYSTLIRTHTLYNLQVFIKPLLTFFLNDTN